MNLLKFFIIWSIVLSVGIYASSIDEDFCLVQGRIVDVSSSEVMSENISIEILSTESADCPVKDKSIYEVTNNTPGVFKKDMIVSSSIREGSSMWPNGVIKFLLWSDVVESGKISEWKYEFQSDSSPLSEPKITNQDAATNSRKYFVYGAYLAIIMVIASSISQVQKYLKK